MTTKNCFLFFKDRRQKFDLSVPEFEWNPDNQYKNLILNQNHHFKEAASIHSKSISLCDKAKNNALKKVKDSILDRDLKERNYLKLWNYNSKTSTSLNLCGLSKNNFTSMYKNSNATNNSTLSLHISAYENSIEINDIGDDPIKKQQNFGKELIQNSFEFPRQQKNESLEPETMQFKSFQQLFNPENSDKRSKDKSDKNKVESSDDEISLENLIPQGNYDLPPLNLDDLYSTRETFNPESTTPISKKNSDLDNLENSFNESNQSNSDENQSLSNSDVSLDLISTPLFTLTTIKNVRHFTGATTKSNLPIEQYNLPKVFEK